jgi:hypothetical protein
VHDCQIIGLLDGFRSEGEMFGFSIISLDEAARRGVELIVIAARAASQKIVFDRIKDFCRKQGIGLLGPQGNDLFDVYAATYETKEHLSDFEYGQCVYAPVVSRFVVWLMERLLDRDYGCILFFSRDGYIFKQMYDELRGDVEGDLPKSVYFLTSRTACAAAVSDVREFAEYFAGFAYEGTPEQLLRDRFFLDEALVEPFSLGQTIEEYARKHFGLIACQAQTSRQGYLEYIKATCPSLLDKDKRIAVFDLVSSGTCQMCLEEICERALDGYCLAQIKEGFARKAGLNIEAMLDSNNSNVLEHYFGLELAVKKPSPSLWGFTADGEPLFRESPYDERTKESVLAAQAGIIAYFRENISGLLRTELKKLRFFNSYARNDDNDSFQKFLYLENIDGLTCDLLEHGIYKDEFTQREAHL